MTYKAGDKVKIIGDGLLGPTFYKGSEGVVEWVNPQSGACRLEGMSLLYPPSSLHPVPAFAVGSRVQVIESGVCGSLIATYTPSNWQGGHTDAPDEVYMLADGSLHTADELTLLPEPRTPSKGEVWEADGDAMYVVDEGRAVNLNCNNLDGVGKDYHRELAKEGRFLAPDLRTYFAQAVSK